MAFDLAAIMRELEAAPPAADLPWEVGVAVLSDTLRLSGLAPPSAGAWKDWRKRWARAAALVPELARALTATSLRAGTVSTLEAQGALPRNALDQFFDDTSLLTQEMVRSNPFRREELLRYWIERCGGKVAGESDAQSNERLAQLDYRKALAEYKKAESSRKLEAKRRAQLLREAKQREEQAKGWRE